MAYTVTDCAHSFKSTSSCANDSGVVSNRQYTYVCSFHDTKAPVKSDITVLATACDIYIKKPSKFGLL